MRGHIFDQTPVDEYFRGLRKKIEDEIDAMPEEHLRAELDLLWSYFAEKHCVRVPILSDNVEIEDPARNLHQQSVHIKLLIPFEGDPDLFRVQPRTSPIMFESWSIQGSSLAFSITVDKDRPQDLIRKKDELVKQLNSGLASLREDVQRPFETLREAVKNRVQSRLHATAKHDRFIESISNIISIRKRPQATEIVTPTKRKPPPLPPAAERADPLVEMSAYEDILKTILAMVSVFERTPDVFRKMKEEDLRMILLVGLNGLYEGGATGETFNGTGKTDILIRRNDRNAFIAECLVWEGQAGLLRKMDDQLFKYATWRDSKVALLVFNRNENFTEVVGKMKDTVRSHSQCVRELPCSFATGSRYEFVRADNSRQRFILTALAFNVPH